ncbi:MAG: GtrA family protein, partial [Polyangia bacterium]
VQFYCNAVSFLLYKYWAFDAAHVGRGSVQYARQLVIFGGSLALNTAIPSVLSYRLHIEPVIAFIASQVVVYLAWNYPGNRYWVFRREGGA